MTPEIMSVTINVPWLFVGVAGVCAIILIVKFIKGLFLAR
jgi:hypothetical protein